MERNSISARLFNFAETSRPALPLRKVNELLVALRRHCGCKTFVISSYRADVGLVLIQVESNCLPKGCDT